MRFESEHNFRKIVGENINNALKLENISATYLAHELNISSAAVGNWRNGKRLPSLWLAYQSANFLDMSLQRLLLADKTTPIMDEKMNPLGTLPFPSSHSFAFRIPKGDDSNAPHFIEDDLALVNRSTKSDFGSIVIAKHFSGHYFLSKYTRGGPGSEGAFTVLNDRVGSYTCSARIVGKVTGMYRHID